MYILAASTISHQPTFRNIGFSNTLKHLKHPSAIVHPDYKVFIPGSYRRRMSDVIKMATTCALDAQQQSGIEQPDAIIVGTSMGCTRFTQHFLDNVLAAGDGPVSPTAFIFSTHNTIAGQISLLLGNHQYNMTHTQNSLSFEHALLDGLLLGREGKSNILLGGADEMGDALYNLEERLEQRHLPLACGASFFVLASKRPAHAVMKVRDVGCYGLVDDRAGTIVQFLQANDCSPESIQLVLYGSLDPVFRQALSKMFPAKHLVDYQAYSGIYYSNPAFAMAFGVDAVRCGAWGERKAPGIRVLLVNNLIPENLGLILLERDWGHEVGE